MHACVRLKGWHLVRLAAVSPAAVAVAVAVVVAAVIAAVAVLAVIVVPVAVTLCPTQTVLRVRWRLGCSVTGI